MLFAPELDVANQWPGNCVVWTPVLAVPVNDSLTQLAPSASGWPWHGIERENYIKMKPLALRSALHCNNVSDTSDITLLKCKRTLLYPKSR